MATAQDFARYRANRQDEIDSAALYGTLADSEKQPALATVYRKLSETETEHAHFWEARLREAGQPVPTSGLSWRARTLIFLAKRFGAQFILPTITGLEQKDDKSYRAQPEAGTAAMASQEQSHALILSELTNNNRGGMAGSALASLEGRHRSAGGNALRAAVLGANDGLLSNLSLIMGVAGAESSGQAIIVAGFAGLLAGASSMALGEWLSVQSSRELYERQIKIESDELNAVPAEEEEELALIYQAKGLTPEQAKEFAGRLISDKGAALDTLSREELGIDPQELGGSAYEAAATSFVLFSLGAIVPLFPFFILTGTTAVVTSVVLSALALFGIGAAITLLTGQSVWFSGLRMVLFGLAAAAITFAVGKIIGVRLAG